jgi:hypothetical protein
MNAVSSESGRDPLWELPELYEGGESGVSAKPHSPPS